MPTRPRSLLLAFATFLCILVGFAGPAAAATSPPAGTYVGNQCGSARSYLANSGAESCVWIDSYTPHVSFSFAMGAVDYARDGYSARNYTYVYQYYNGAWHYSYWILTNSSGYGYTKVSGAVGIRRVTGATNFSIVIYACTYNAPTAVNISCAHKTAVNGTW